MKTALLVVALLLVGCNKEQKSESYSYDLSLNGCATGKHTFSSKGEMCAALKDDVRNNNCAYSLRKQTFESNGCPGGFNSP